MPAKYAQYKEWIDRTHVVDGEGLPLVVYRGEHGDSEEAIHTRLPSISFGTREAANTYALSPNNSTEYPHAPRVMAAYLSIRKPLVNNPKDPFIDFPILASAIGVECARDVFVQFGDYIYNTDNWATNFDKYESVDQVPLSEMDGLYVDLYPLLDNPNLVEQLKKNGFDGAIHAGAGQTAMEPEYKVFSVEQIRCAWCLDVPLDHLRITDPAEDVLAVAAKKELSPYTLS